MYGHDDYGPLATMSDAHSEWHRNAGVPMGQPGCPQDACDPYDYEGEAEWAAAEDARVRAEWAEDAPALRDGEEPAPLIREGWGAYGPIPLDPWAIRVLASDGTWDVEPPF